MHEAGLKGAGALVVVARILVKERGEDRMSQEVTAASVDKPCRITFAVSRGTLPVTGIGVRRLLDAGSRGRRRSRQLDRNVPRAASENFCFQVSGAAS